MHDSALKNPKLETIENKLPCCVKFPLVGKLLNRNFSNASRVKFLNYLSEVYFPDFSIVHLSLQHYQSFSYKEKDKSLKFNENESTKNSLENFNPIIEQLEVFITMQKCIISRTL